MGTPVQMSRRQDCKGFTLLGLRGDPGPQEQRFKSIYGIARIPDDAGSGEVRVDRAPGRIGFKMSTQRRASQTIAAIEVDCAQVRRRWFFSGRTAPLMSIVWLAWAWLLSFDASSVEAVDREATNSLLPDCHNERLAWLDSRSGSAPPGATLATTTGRPGHRCWAGVHRQSTQRGTHRSSLRHVSLLPVRTRLRPTLPIAPAGQVRWAERHDGKRDLYFQHAA